MRRRKILSLFLGAIALLSLASFIGANKQIVKADEASSLGEGYGAILYDNSNGLPTSEANAIVQSRDGYIWIGGYAGLIRYDSNEFYRYDSSTGVASVVSLFVDSKDRLWIGTNDSGIARLHDNEFTFYNYFKDDESVSVRAINEDPEGNIFFGTTLGVYYIDTNFEVHRLNDPIINSEYICELNANEDGEIYGVTLSGGVFVIKNQKLEFFFRSSELEVSMGIVNTIYPDHLNSGYAYLGNQENDIYYGRLDEAMDGAIHLSTGSLENLNSIREYDNMLWVIADNGIGQFTTGYRQEGATFTVFKKLPMNNSIDRMLRDHEANMWFCSSRQGVMKIVRNNFVDISDLAELPALVVNSTAIDNDLLYIATDTGLRILDNNYQLVENALTALLTGVRIRCILKDSTGLLWFATYGETTGLVCYNPANGDTTCLTKDDGMAANRVRMAIELADGSIAASTNNGVNIIQNKTVVKTLDASIGLSNLEILTIAQMSDGRLLLGSDGDGIYVVDGNLVSRVGIADGLKSGVILRIKKDKDLDLYWIITSNSISYLKDGVIYNVDFPYANNFDIFFDNYDRIWVLSSNGIYCASKQSIFNGKIEYSHYDKDCGLPAIATANAYSYIDDTGLLYVSASTGVFSVNINTDFGTLGDVILAIPNLVIDDQYFAIGENNTIIVSSNAKRINIYAKAFTYSLYNPKISYYLEGFDDEEIVVNKNDLKAVTYTNLKGGTYTFHLKLLNSLTDEVEQEYTVTIVKQKALSEYIIFWIGLGVVIAAALLIISFLLNRQRLNRVMAKQKENQKLINEMTQVFARCIDMKDEYTRGHSSRVALYTSLIAKQLGKSDEEVSKIYNIALLHDIGKISIPDKILNKPGKLDDEEYAVMKSHSPNGYNILKDITIAPEIAIGAGAHHERYDGRGYPNGLKGEEIPEVAQIIAVADTFDAMYSTRPYRRQMPLEEVVNEIKRCSGSQFNPKMVDAFLKVVDSGVLDNINNLTIKDIIKNYVTK